MPLVNRPDVLDLELAVTQAELILAVRLVEVTETKIVHGGRDVQVTEQYRFEPVRILKGIFARESLLLTGQDLGIYRFAGGSDRLPRGQLMLVLLGRQGQNYFNCCAAPTLAQSIPRLESKEDPLLARRRSLDRDDPPERPHRPGRALARRTQKDLGPGGFALAASLRPARSAGGPCSRGQRINPPLLEFHNRLDQRARSANASAPCSRLIGPGRPPAAPRSPRRSRPPSSRPVPMSPPASP